MPIDSTKSHSGEKKFTINSFYALKNTTNETDRIGTY